MEEKLGGWGTDHLNSKCREGVEVARGPVGIRNEDGDKEEHGGLSWQRGFGHCMWEQWIRNFVGGGAGGRKAF